MKDALVCIALLLFAETAALSADPVTTPDAYRDPDRLAQLINGTGPAYVLVDVRTAEEYQSGHIPSAINIPVGEIHDHPPTADASALIIVYCASGGRSARAKTILNELGYTLVVDFGGIVRWTGDVVSQDK